MNKGIARDENLFIMQNERGKKVHILFDARTLDDHFPGIGRYTFHLLAALHHRKDVTLTLLINPRARNSRFPPPQQAFPRARHVLVPYSPFDWRVQLIVLWATRNLTANLYHSPYYLMAYTLTLPTVVTFHDVIPSLFPAYFSPPKRLLIRLLKTLTIKKAKALLADSQATAEDIAHFYKVPRHRLTVAPLAADPQFSPPSPTALTAFQTHYGLPPRYMLYVGSDKPHKNLPFLLDLWKILAQRFPSPPTLVLAGPIQRSINNQTPYIRKLGFIPEKELPLLYGGAVALLFPSLYEGFGLPALEAMACGTPVIYHDVPALREVVASAGWPLSLNDRETWIQTLIQVWEDAEYREVYARRALARAKMFTWEKTADITVRVYREVLGQ